MILVFRLLYSDRAPRCRYFDFTDFDLAVVLGCQWLSRLVVLSLWRINRRVLFFVGVFGISMFSLSEVSLMMKYIM